MLNEYTGEIGKRQDFDVTCTKTLGIEGNYGVRTMVKFADPDGRIIIWWATGEVELEVGKQYRIKATVKKHEEYKGWKQTIVTRAKCTIHNN